MTTSRERILELVAAGKLSPADAETMLASKRTQRAGVVHWLANPIAHLPTRVALGLTAVIVAATVGLSRAGVGFSGPLSTQPGSPGALSWRATLLDVGSSWLLPALIFWGLTLVFSRRARLLDFLLVVGLARAPGLIAAGAALGIHRRDPVSPETIGRLLSQGTFLIFLFLLLACLSWQVTMLVLGFKTASGLRGVRWVSAFLVGLASSEVLGVALRALR